MTRRTPFLAMFAVLAGSLSAIRAQVEPTTEAAAPARYQPDGWHLYSANAFTGYMSLALPDANFNYLTGAVPLGADIQTGGALNVGWDRVTSRSGIYLSYEPSYNRMMRHPEWSALNHGLSFRASRKIGRKWAWDSSTSGSVNNLNQFLFLPTTLSRAAAVPATIDDLAGAILGGRITNTELASALTGATVLEAPTRAAIYGNRMLSVSASTSLSYTHSRRVALHFRASGWRNQSLKDGRDSQAARSDYVVPRTTTGSASAGLTYSFNPRTDFGLEASGDRTISIFQDAYRTKVSASLGRRIGARWFVQGSGGAVRITAVRKLYELPEGLQYAASANISFRIVAHSFLATAERSPLDTYGIAAGHTLSAGGTWKWHRPRGSWELFSSVRQQRMRGGWVQNLDGWICSGGVARMMSRQMVVQLTYSYLKNTGTYLGASRDIAVHAVQLGFGWRGPSAK